MTSEHASETACQRPMPPLQPSFLSVLTGIKIASILLAFPLFFLGVAGLLVGVFVALAAWIVLIQAPMIGLMKCWSYVRPSGTDNRGSPATFFTVETLSRRSSRANPDRGG